MGSNRVSDQSLIYVATALYLQLLHYTPPSVQTTRHSLLHYNSVFLFLPIFLSFFSAIHTTPIPFLSLVDHSSLESNDLFHQALFRQLSISHSSLPGILSYPAFSHQSLVLPRRFTSVFFACIAFPLIFLVIFVQVTKATMAKVVRLHKL